MNIDQAWLSDNQLHSISNGMLSPQSRANGWITRYVTELPSEFYRGRATVFSILIEGMRQGIAMQTLIDGCAQSLHASRFGLAHITVRGAVSAIDHALMLRQADSGDRQSAGAIGNELICTARIFFDNRERGI